MTEEYIRTTLQVHLENGDSFTTGFNLTPEMFKSKTVQEIVDSYYVNRNYYTHNEIAHRITHVDILGVADVITA
jgi:hypothetical protein